MRSSILRVIFLPEAQKEMTEKTSIPPGRADIAIINGAVYTADRETPRCNAVAVRDGIITAAGDNSEILAHVGSETVLIDAAGRAVLPGMVDSHMHLLGGSRGRHHNICLSPEMDHEDYLKAIAEYMAAHPEKEIYTGTGFMPELYDCCGPKKEWLDAVCPHKPMIILSYDGHSTWVNSKALELRGITKDTPDPENGVIHRHAETGEPTGYLAGSAGACAGGMMRRFMPRYDRSQNRESILISQQKMFEKGITSVYDAHVDPDEDYYMAYEELAREGKLLITVRGAWFIPRDYGTEEEICALIDRCIAISETFRTDKFKINGFKFLCDQVCECETAYLCEPYCDRCDGWRGLRIWEDGEMLARLFAKIDAAGFQIHLHQIGDGAARYALDALEKAAAINGGLSMRHTFAHCQFIGERDKARMAKMGVNALVAPYWINTTIYSTMDVPHFGPERALRQYPVGSLMDAGINVAVHSDYPVSAPDWCDAIYGLTARSLSPRAFDVFYRRIAGASYTLDEVEPREDICCPLPGRDERISTERAVEVMTRNGACSMYTGDSCGAIMPGMAADIVLLSRDINGLAMPGMAKSAKNMLTICAGRIVYDEQHIAMSAY